MSKKKKSLNRKGQKELSFGTYSELLSQNDSVESNNESRSRVAEAKMRAAAEKLADSEMNSDATLSSMADESASNNNDSSSADISRLVSEVKSSLFHFDDSMDFIENQEESKIDVTNDAELEMGMKSDSDGILDEEQPIEQKIFSEIEDQGIVQDQVIAQNEVNAEFSEIITSKTHTEAKDLIFVDEEIIETEDLAAVEETLETVEKSPSVEISQSNEIFAMDEISTSEESSPNEAEAIVDEESKTLNDSLFSEDETTVEGFAQGPEVVSAPTVHLEGTELAQFESAEIEDLESITEEQLQSIIESILFASDRPVSLSSIKQVFQGTNVNNARIREVIERLKSHYASTWSGVSLEDVGSGYQLRTRLDNMEFLRRSLKARPFKLSGPALEVLAIVAYKQPIVKHEIDEIRGVESGHLLRALMEKNLVIFAGKSDLPGKPMQYETSRKFLEIFSLRNLRELPTLSQIDELLPEGITEEDIQKPKLDEISEGLSQHAGKTYSEGEEELNKITDQLQQIHTSSEFFEQEKIRLKAQRDAEKAQNLREAIAVGEVVSPRDLNWLRKYEIQLQEPNQELAPQQETLPAESDSHFDSKNGVKSEDESEELNQLMSEIESTDSIPWADPEILEANDIADIEE